MTGPQAPPGWYPDPSDQGTIRYWDGTTWTEYKAAPEAPEPTSQPGPTETGPTELPSVVSEPGRGWMIVAIVVLVAFMIVGALVYTSDDPGDPAPPFGAQPPDQRAVVDLIQDAREQYDAANHDLQRDAALAERDEQICALLGDGRVENWTGQVYDIDSGRDGEGILGINIEPDTQVTTRSGALSGADHTLIPPGPLLDRITELETDQVVTFSGRFVPDERDDSCFTNPRFTQRQAIDKPLMVFRFTDVRR